MSQLPKLVARRKTVRARVTSCHNNRGTYDALSPTDLHTVKANILDYKEDLKTFDDLIQNLKFVDVDTIDENELQKETDTCDEYMSKIRECLAIINRVSVSPPRNAYVDIDVTRSLLKQPTAPLPKFSGDENEDLIKFITEFELTTSSFNETGSRSPCMRPRSDPPNFGPIERGEKQTNNID